MFRFRPLQFFFSKMTARSSISQAQGFISLALIQADSSLVKEELRVASQHLEKAKKLADST